MHVGRVRCLLRRGYEKLICNAGGAFTTAGGMVSAYAVEAILPPEISIVPDGYGGFFINAQGFLSFTCRLQRAPIVQGPWDTGAPQSADTNGFIHFHDLFAAAGQGVLPHSSALTGRERGLCAVKPDRFCYWLFEFLGIEPHDEFHDLFPDFVAVNKAWHKWEAFEPHRRITAELFGLFAQDKDLSPFAAKPNRLGSIAGGQTGITIFSRFLMVPMEGVEPTQPYGYQILSLARLPIPPHRLIDNQRFTSIIMSKLEPCDTIYARIAIWELQQPHGKTSKSSSSRRYKYTKVLDNRKHPIRGLWKRNGDFVARITVEDGRI